MPQFTILTAVYNAEQHLATCLDSLQQQSLTDFEVICIDDASTDGSLELLNAYAARDSRIRVIHSAMNRGAAFARNLGLVQARGEWITMLDADDWFAPDTLEQLAATIATHPQADSIMMTLMKTTGPDDASPELYPTPNGNGIYTGAEAFQLSLDWSLHGLYATRANIHRRYPYDTSCHLFSDDNTTRIHYLHSRQVVQSAARYYYRQHKASMTHKASLHHFEYIKANFSMKLQLMAEARQSDAADIDWQHVLNTYETHRWLNFVGEYWYYWKHANAFSDDERRKIFATFRRFLPTIERQWIPLRQRLKPGYIPFRSFTLFRLSCCSYFWLRRKIRRI